MEVETTTAIAAAVVGSQSWETAKHPPFDSVMKQKRCSCFQLYTIFMSLTSALIRIYLIERNKAAL